MKTYVIAEIGINHNGDIDLARKMIDSAKEYGANAVKFQRRNPDKCYTQEELAKPCLSPWGTTIRDKVVGREFKFGDWEKINSHCQSIGMPWSASCWDWESFLLHEEFNPPWHKIASTMALNERFVRGVAERRKLTFVSTGLLNWNGVEAIVGVFEEYGCPYILFHAVSLYPCPADRLELKTISRFCVTFLNEQRYPYCRGIGYSGHEVGVPTSVVAVSLGARWIERHFTLDRTLYGGDQAASLEPEGLGKLVKYIETIEPAMGDGRKVLHGDEKAAISVDIQEWW